MKKQLPFDFVFEELSELDPTTKPMFGCHSVYVRGKIVFILRSRGKPTEDDGVWLATTEEHHASLLQEFPSMRSITIFGPGVTGWQVLPVEADDFEESVLRACELVRAADPRIGKVPKAKLARSATKATKATKKKVARKKVVKKKAGPSQKKKPRKPALRPKRRA